MAMTYKDLFQQPIFQLTLRNERKTVEWAFVLPSPTLLHFVYQLRYRYFRFKIPLRSNSMKRYLRNTVQ